MPRQDPISTKVCPNGLGLNDTPLWPISLQLGLALVVGNIRPMTIGTFLRGRCVKKYSLAIYYSAEFVAIRTAPVAVGFPERKGRLPIVVEE